jgi:histidine ammonia-lyase
VSSKTTILEVVFGGRPLTLEQICDVAQGRARARLNPAPEYRARLEASRASLERQLRAGRVVYGVTTGVGESCENQIPPELTDQLSTNLFRFHGVGTGAPLTDEEAAAVVAARIASLACGHSGVRPLIIDRLVLLLEKKILPRIPAEGSVGASGDLTPLSYVAAVLAGEREVSFAGEVIPAAQALERCGLEPLTLRPKEALALMNGTSMMTGLACLAFRRARQLARLSSALSAMASELMRGNPSHFDARLFAVKPHPGSAACAAWLRDDLEYDPGAAVAGARVQDRYSIRCAPHVIGVLLDALALFRPILETEVNSANDNPIVDAERDEVLHGGNFYGGHVAFAMDGLKAAVASVADLLDRQLALLCNPATSHGLPANLIALEGGAQVAHHGFKAMQITASALTAEALKLTMPATVFSRSTESHNQDKVSMGSIAARDCQRVLELAETVAIIELLALCQAVDLRGPETCKRRSRALHAAVRALVARNDGDRRQDVDIAAVLAVYRRGELPFGIVDFPG